MSCNERSSSSDSEDDIKVIVGKRLKKHSVNMLEVLAAQPLSVRRRLHALKNLQLAITNLESSFYEDVHLLEIKYMRLFYPHLDKRADIVTGRHEPDDVECQWDSDIEIDVKNEDSLMITEDPKGIPEFWLTVFKNITLLSEMVQEHDEPVLRQLEDIKVILMEKEPMGFVLEFHFSPNEYFTNLVLTKEYRMKCAPDPDSPFDFEGPEIVQCFGCTINWRKDMNLTTKTSKKNRKNSQGVINVITRTVQRESFFNFFSPPEVPADASPELADELESLLSTDFEIGHYLRDRVVPHAVLLFTGEGLEEENSGDDEYSSESDSSDVDYVPPPRKGRKGRGDADSAMEQEDCKHQ